MISLKELYGAYIQTVLQRLRESGRSWKCIRHIGMMQKAHQK